MLSFISILLLLIAVVAFGTLSLSLFIEKKAGDDPYPTPPGGTYEYKVEYYRIEDTKEPITSISVPLTVPEGSFTIHRPKPGDQWPSDSPYATKLNNEEFKAAVAYSEAENKKEKKKTTDKKKKKKTKGKRK